MPRRHSNQWEGGLQTEQLLNQTTKWTREAAYLLDKKKLLTGVSERKKQPRDHVQLYSTVVENVHGEPITKITSIAQPHCFHKTKCFVARLWDIWNSISTFSQTLQTFYVSKNELWFLELSELIIKTLLLCSHCFKKNKVFCSQGLGHLKFNINVFTNTSNIFMPQTMKWNSWNCRY